MTNERNRCAVEGCSKPARSNKGRGWCSMHNERWRRYGSTKDQRPGMVKRFFDKVDTSAGQDSCHEWMGSRNSKGYGKFSIATSSSVLATRWVVEQHQDRVLKRDELVLHKCDNPPCVNVRHLYVGDYKQNARDAVERGQHSPWQRKLTACINGHEYNDANTQFSHKDGKIRRKCKVCRVVWLQARKLNDCK